MNDVNDNVAYIDLTLLAEDIVFCDVSYENGSGQLHIRAKNLFHFHFGPGKDDSIEDKN